MASAKKNGNGSEKRRRRLAILLTCVLAIGAFALAFPPQEKINQGLDIQGGLSLVLEAKTKDGAAPSTEDMDKAKSIIEKRVNALGASEASVQIQGDSQILVQIPGLSDSQEALDTIGTTGVLEFTRADSITDETTASAIASGNIKDYSTVKLPEGEMPTGALDMTDYSTAKGIEIPEGSYTVLFTGDNISRVTVDRENEASPYYAVHLELDPSATNAFSKATQELVSTNGQICIVLDGRVESCPAVQSAITDGRVAITGNYTLESANALKTVLESGSLPVSFTYESAQTVGPTLGMNELTAGLIAMLAGLLLVIIYLFVFYRGMGIFPALNMLLFGVIDLGVFAALSAMGFFSLSLAGIAGIILSIGMSADSAILCVENFRGFLKKGKTPKTSARDGVKEAVIASVDADVVSLITAAALFFFATSTVKGFGLTLSVGILCDLFVTVAFVAPLMRLMAEKVIPNHPGFFHLDYALALGDVRTGSNNYRTAADIAADKAKDAEKAEREKEAERKKKERNKAADVKAKEMRAEAKAKEKDAKKAEKAAKKEALGELKAADAKRDAERKAAREDEKAAKKAQQSENNDAEEKKLGEPLEEAPASEPESPADAAVPEEADNSSESDDKPTNGVVEGAPVGTDSHREHAPEENEDLLDSIVGGDIPIRETQYEREENPDMKMSGPETVEIKSAVDTVKEKEAGNALKMNRAQRRAAARQNKKK